jgi:predicted CopG family antitoxin
MSGAKRVNRVNVDFSDEAYSELRRLADTQHKSISDVVRDALSLERWVEEEESKGSRILVERDGVLRELIRRK